MTSILFDSDSRLQAALAKADGKKIVASGRTVAFTSINWRYLPKAMILARSLKKYNPRWEFHLLVNDYVDPEVSFEHVDVVVPINSIGIDNFHSWCFSHDVVELCTATKASYFRNLLESGYDKIFYFDPDMEVFSDLSILEEELDSSDTLLTPHCDIDAIRDVEIRYTEMSVLAHGVFNLGFLGIKNSLNGRKVIDFWVRRMERYCVDDHARGLFTDQKWFNLVPVYFDGVRVLKHSGCNVASWNITHRPLSKRDGKMCAGDNQLLFFHFSGYDSAVPRRMFEMFGAYNECVNELIGSYDEQVAEWTERLRSSIQLWVYGRFDNGLAISRAVRRFYRSSLDHRLNFPQPFFADAKPSFWQHLSQTDAGEIERQFDPSDVLKKYY